MSVIEQKTFTEAEQARRMEKLEELWQAVEANKANWVIARAYECDHKMPNVDGRTALMYAAFLGHNECVEKLAYGLINPDVAAPDHHGRTALHSAAVGGNPLCIRNLVTQSARGEYESRILLKDADGKSSIDIALKMGRYSFVNRLLDFVVGPRKEAVVKKHVLPHLQGNPLGVISALAAHVELRDVVAKHVASLDREGREWRGRSALHLAAMAGADSAVKNMLAQGHDPRALDSHHQTPLMACAQVGKPDSGVEPWVNTAKLLIPVTDVYWADREGRTALMHAAHAKNLAMVELLLPYSDVNACDDKRNTALAIAAKRAYGQTDIVELLTPLTMKYDAIRSSSKQDIQGRNLRRCAQEGDVAKLTKMLVNEKKRSQSEQDRPLDKFHWECARLPLVFRQDQWGVTALMEAASHGHVACVEVLLEHGADPLARDSSGNSPLLFAVLGGHLDCARLLIPRSHVDAKNEVGSTALQMAFERRNEPMCDLLCEVSRLDILNLDQ